MSRRSHEPDEARLDTRGALAASAPWVLLCLLTTGCGDDSKPAADTIDTRPGDTLVADGTADAAEVDDAVTDVAPPDATPDPSAVTFAFVERPGGPPIPDVTAVWTAPGGDRVEAASDAEGRVVFGDNDWSRGMGQLVAVKAGYSVRGVLASEDLINSPEIFRTPEGAVLIVMSPLTPPPTITVSGIATGMNETDNLVIGSDVPGGFIVSRQGPRFQLEVPPETPFNWVAATWTPNGQPVGRNIDNTIHTWASGTSPGGADDYTMELALGSPPIAPESVTGSFPLPASEHGALRESCIARVYVFGHRGFGSFGGLVGMVPTSTISEDGATASYVLEWITPEWATEPSVLFACDTASEASRAIVNGWPTEGAQAVDLLPPPTWANAGGAAVAQPIDQPFEWTNEAPDMIVTLAFRLGSSQDAPIGAAFNLPPGTTRFELPELPGDYDLFVANDVRQIYAELTLCDPDPELGECERFALSKRTPVGPADAP